MTAAALDSFSHVLGNHRGAKLTPTASTSTDNDCQWHVWAARDGRTDEVLAFLASSETHPRHLQRVAASWAKALLTEAEKSLFPQRRRELLLELACALPGNDRHVVYEHAYSRWDTEHPAATLKHLTKPDVDLLCDPDLPLQALCGLDLTSVTAAPAPRGAWAATNGLVTGRCKQCETVVSSASAELRQHADENRDTLPVELRRRYRKLAVAQLAPDLIRMAEPGLPHDAMPAQAREVALSAWVTNAGQVAAERSAERFRYLCHRNAERPSFAAVVQRLAGHPGNAAPSAQEWARLIDSLQGQLLNTSARANGSGLYDSLRALLAAWAAEQLTG